MVPDGDQRLGGLLRDAHHFGNAATAPRHRYYPGAVLVPGQGANGTAVTPRLGDVGGDALSGRPLVEADHGGRGGDAHLVDGFLVFWKFCKINIMV